MTSQLPGAGVAIGCARRGVRRSGEGASRALHPAASVRVICAGLTPEATWRWFIEGCDHGVRVGPEQGAVERDAVADSMPVPIQSTQHSPLLGGRPQRSRASSRGAFADAPTALKRGRGGIGDVGWERGVARYNPSRRPWDRRLLDKRKRSGARLEKAWRVARNYRDSIFCNGTDGGLDPCRHVC